MTFLQNLNETLQEKWAKANFVSEMPIQTKLIPHMLDGSDIVAESPTGTGKTLAYVLPILQKVDPSKKHIQALVIVPSQELGMQIVEVFREWVAGTDITVAQLIGGANIQRQLDVLKKKPTIVVGTPGRLQELVKLKKLKMHEIKTIVLDEGDQLLSRENRTTVKGLIDATVERQLVVTSATITEEIELVAERIMNNPVRIQVTAEEIPSKGEVIHSFVKTEVRDKTELLRKLSHLEGMKGLAFVNSLDQVLMKDTKLSYRDAPIISLHSEMKKEERKKALDDFKNGKVNILIATDVAARGLDISGLTHVIHVDVPHSIEQYLHRSGRTGRAGNDGEVLTLLTYGDEKTYKKWTKELPSKPVQKIWYRGELIEGSSKTVQKKGK
ncbi:MULTISPECIES: DEAD/DEAH box helicase [Bacillaceae]|uniref:DEAD/DEAH box helicase n=1 Tax=Bacillaceae TaxID=186817 RepID=UPI0006F9EAC2|nr:MULTISPECIES: DEAD/DEAH box helicase [Bacillaceae]KQL32445.1 RNA helicase [Psychrobacillus sp. FJAT-21963]MDF2068413.1 DEAD/DEAH box helicase [Bacillus sp. Cr_A10]